MITLLMRHSPTSLRNIIGPWTQAYCRAIGGRFLKNEVPLLTNDTHD